MFSGFKRKALTPLLGLAALTVAQATAIQATAGEVNTGYFGNAAIEGYDPVAYFTEGRATKGSENYAVEWLDAVWHFANADHREIFRSSPISYMPQFGGHCADGVGYGGRNANIDPEAWDIIDGKLYLSATKASADHLKTTDGHLEKAKRNWPKVRTDVIADSSKDWAQ